jgi:starch synthase
MGWRSQYCGLFELRRGGVTWYFWDNEFYFGRDNAYGYFDEGERWPSSPRRWWSAAGICRSFSRTCSTATTGTPPMAPVFLREQYRYAPQYGDIRTFSPSTTAVQGQYDPTSWGTFWGCTMCRAREPSCARQRKCVNFMAGAVNYSDSITTVSPTYARRFAPPIWRGMQDLFLRRQDILSGILNGIDTRSYDPAADKAIPFHYTEPAGKAANKAALQQELGLETDPDVPLCVAVSRLTEEKGLRLLNAVARRMLSWRKSPFWAPRSVYEERYRQLEASTPAGSAPASSSPNAVPADVRRRGHLFDASRFEPCGLSQMISMRYGTLPVVRQTGVWLTA